MEVYFSEFVNFAKNNWIRLPQKMEFAYNNAKNASTSHMPFELNYSYHPQMLYEEDVNPRFQYKLANELSVELNELMIVYCKNLYYAQKL